MGSTEIISKLYRKLPKFFFEFLNFESKADGKLEKVDGKLMISEIVLTPVLTIPKEEDKERAIRILQKSEVACLISNSIKSIISFQPEIKIN